MKILFSGYHNPNFITITEYFENAIKKLGHELISFDDRNHILPGRLRYRFPLLHKIDARHINHGFIKLARECNPDIAFISGGHRISKESICFLKAKGITTVLYTVDAPHDFQPILNIAMDYDYIFCQGSEAVELLSKAGIKKACWVPVGCDPDIHRSVEVTGPDRIKYCHDIVFVGSYYPNRWEIFKELAEFDFGIWGPHWEDAIGPVPRNISIQSGNFIPDEWLKIFSCAKIVLIAHYQDGKVPCYQASPKVFEALACKKMVVVDRQPDVINLFKDQLHLAGYDTVADLKSKIRYYLNNPIESDKIALAGYNEVLQNHTYVHRMKVMLARIGTSGNYE
jgi:spore maturation protein CgeB